MQTPNIALAKGWLERSFPYTDDIAKYIDEQTFLKRCDNFFKNYDDFYHDHFAHYGDKKNALKAIVIATDKAFTETYGHMDLCYNPCAISSGTRAHLQAVQRNHFTSQRLGDVLPKQIYIENIKSNSVRTINRVQKIQKLCPDETMIVPPKFESGTRVFQSGGSLELTGGEKWQDAEYMAFWNPRIAQCTSFNLDDVFKDAPSIKQVKSEIKQAQKSDKISHDSKYPTYTNDWNNSRNSILEMAMGTYIQFGLHPMRPDANMDMRLYHEDQNILYTATLLDRSKAIAQNMLRWGAQGIACEEAVRTLVRFIHLHRMRTNPQYNAQQYIPLDLGALDPAISNPSKVEKEEFDNFITKIEPFILKYYAHLYRAEGLPEKYKIAQDNHPIEAKHRGNDIINGSEIMAWQRTNVPQKETLDLFKITQPNVPEAHMIKPKPTAYGIMARTQPRVHNFDDIPFIDKQPNEIWIDDPFEDLDAMSKDQLRIILGALEACDLPINAKEFNGVHFDMKAGTPAIKQMSDNKISDITLLPGVLGKKFKTVIANENWKSAQYIAAEKRIKNHNNENIKTVSFSTHLIKNISNALKDLRSNFPGPGPLSPNSDFRMALEMEMARRNYTTYTIQDNWQASPNSARIILQATKIEFGKINRPGKNNTELGVYNQNGDYISFFKRYNLLKEELNRISSDPQIIQRLKQGKETLDEIETLNIKHISLSLARLLEIHNCLVDQNYNQDNGYHFYLKDIEHKDSFEKDIDKIQKTKIKTKNLIMNKWIWMWDEDDLKDLDEGYTTAWHKAQGIERYNARPKPTDDHGIEYGHQL